MRDAVPAVKKKTGEKRLRFQRKCSTMMKTNTHVPQQNCDRVYKTQRQGDLLTPDTEQSAVVHCLRPTFLIPPFTPSSLFL